MSATQVLYLSYDGLLEPLGSSQVVRVVEGLGREGFKIEVVSFEKPADLARTGEVEETRALLKKVGIAWIPLRYHRRPSIPATGYDIWRGAKEVVRIARKNEGRVLFHARSYVAGLMCLQGIRGFQGIGGTSGGFLRLLFDMRGFWVDERVEAGSWRSGGVMEAVARKVESTLLREADGVVHLTNAAKGALSGRVSCPSWVIPTLTDLRIFYPPQDPSALRQELGIGPGPVLMHVGALNRYLSDLTFSVGRAWTDLVGGSFLVLTGQEMLARGLARKHRVKALIRKVPFQEIPKWMGVGDAGLALARPSRAGQAMSPTRMGEYLSTGLAVAATRGTGDMEAYLDGSPVAVLVAQNDDPAGIAEALAVSAKNPGRVELARELAERRYDLSAGVATYARIYEQMGVERIRC